MRFLLRLLAVIASMLVILAACKPAEPPPDLIKTQRDALDKSKSVEGQLQQQANEQRKAVESAEK
jgi:ABC-type uncharacterized transport system auxiliary subunit